MRKLLTLLLFIFALFQVNAAKYEKTDTGFTVPIMKVSKKKISSVITTYGYVTADIVKVAMELAGRIERIKNWGEKFNTDEVLVKLDSSLVDEDLKALKAQKKAMEANLTYLKNEFNRISKLYKQRVVDLSKYQKISSQYESLKYNLQSVQAKIEKLETTKKKMIYKSKFAGFVYKRIANTSEVALPGKPVLEIIGKKAKLIFWVSQKDLKILPNLISLKTRDFSINLNYKDLMTDNTVQPVTGKRKFEIYLPMKYFGRNYKILLYLKPEEKIIIPLSSILFEDKNSYVLVFKDGKVIKRQVLLGRENNGYIEVLKGLSSGEIIIPWGVYNIPFDGVEKL